MNRTSASLAGFLLVLLSLSIGWGIRGNYGHEAGAMMPGALAGIAMALVSRREDWRRRVPYFAFFGALGWAFGGSIAYMVPPSYTQSGQLSTQVYGFFATFFEGALWAGLGGAVTAFAAVVEDEELTAIFRPLLWVLGFWAIQYVIQDTPFAFQDRIFAAFGADRSDFRQRDPLYWLDCEWLEAVLALTALCAFDLWDRRGAGSGFLVILTLMGAMLGWAIQFLLVANGWDGLLGSALSHPQGDLRLLDSVTGLPRFVPADLVTNWPSLCVKVGHHLGWLMGGMLGLSFYFCRFGAWRSGSLLLVRMALGSLVIFLVGPVLLSNLPWFREMGGFRLAPPRGDSWANILGCYLGFLWHFYRVGRRELVFAGILAGALGGFALTTAQFIKVLCLTPGNPVLTQDALVIEAWKHWRSANWHSLVLEQLAGLFYGLAVYVPLKLLASRTPVHKGVTAVRPWTQVVAVVFVFNGVTYLNLVKNLNDWTEPRKIGGDLFRSVAEILRAPLFGGLAWSPWTWFTGIWVVFTVGTVWVLIRHRRHPVALIPISWAGKGQLLFLGFLWMVVIGNFTKALVAFHESRIATEGLILVNALIGTVLLLGFVRAGESAASIEVSDFRSLTHRSVALAGITLVGAMVFYTAGIRAIYGDRPIGWGGSNLRFGPDADWRIKPIQLKLRHK
jgi:hypothetical protein